MLLELNENERLHFPLRVFLPRMVEHSADLSVTAATIYFFHQVSERAPVRHPEARAAFTEPTIINKLNLEPTDRRHFLKHLNLELAGAIPSPLPGRCGIEREDQTPTRRPSRACEFFLRTRPPQPASQTVRRERSA
jgi:hypothetical protein